MKRKAFTLWLAGMMLLSVLAGCGSNASNDAATDTTTAGNTTTDNTANTTAKTDSKLKIGMALPVRNQFQTDAEKAATALAKSEGIEFTTFDANNDISAQISQVQTCATDGYDAMIVGVANNDSAAEVIQAAGDMPIVFYNMMPTNLTLLDDTHIYVGMDETSAGKAQGEYLAKLMKSEGKGSNLNAVLLMGPLGQDSVVKRTDGAKTALKDAGFNVNYVYEDTAEWDRAKAMDKFTQFLGKGESFDLVICNNDDMALGVGEAIKSSGSKITAPVVGIDATESGCDAVKDGTLAMTVNQDPKNQGETALKMAVDLATKGKTSLVNDEHVLFTEAQIVTKDNVDEVLQGFQK